MLCINESSELEPDLARDCNVALACLASHVVGKPAYLHTIVSSTPIPHYSYSTCSSFTFLSYSSCT